MAHYSFRVLNEQDLAVFSQYLLPQTAQAIRREASSWLVVGAVWERFACGAAAVRCSGSTAELASFFVDPQARGNGVGRRLLERTMEQAGARGCEALSVRFLLAGEELAAMDRLVCRWGRLTAEANPYVYGMDTARYHEHSLLGASFRPGFRFPPSAKPFSSLSAAQLEALEAREDIPAFLRPSVCRAKTEPSLSVAWTVDGVVTGYLLGCETGLRDFSLIAAWQAKPSTAFLHLLRTQLNLCFYRCSGDFRYYASPVTPRAERLLQRLTGGVYTRYEEHAAVLPLNRLR